MGDVPLRWREEERSKCNVSLPLSVIDILLPPALNVPWRDDDCHNNNNNSYVRAPTSRSPPLRMTCPFGFASRSIEELNAISIESCSLVIEN